MKSLEIEIFEIKREDVGECGSVFDLMSGSSSVFVTS